jgi:transposase/transposase-like protein
LRLLRAAVLLPVGEKGGRVLEETQETEELIARVAALDIGKAELVCCVRVPSPDTPGKRLQEVRTYTTMTRSLLVLADRLGELGVTRVVMEATSDYWKSPFYLLEAHGFEVWLVNARDVKHLPGRPKTDRLDAVWLAKVAERQMLRPSFVPPPAIRRLRDLTRYRADLVGVRTAEKQRVEKLLEDAQIKLSVVASDIFGVSGQAMLAALIAGERNPKALAQLARSRMRAKLGQLQEAFTGHFSDHHGFLLQTMVGRIDQASADIAELEAKIEEEIGPFAQAVDRLDEITGVGRTAAQVIIAEIGTDMGRFPTPGHLGLPPGGRTPPMREGVQMPDKQQRNRRQFTPEFKRDAVELVRTSGRPIAEIARELGIYDSTLGNWVKQDRIDRGEREGLTSDERARLRELERDNARLRMERDLLKRTVAFWVKETSTP